MQLEVSSSETHGLPQPTCLYQGILGAHPHGSQATFWISQAASGPSPYKVQPSQTLQHAPTPPATPVSAHLPTDSFPSGLALPPHLQVASSHRSTPGQDSEVQLSGTHSDTSSPSYSLAQSADGGGSSVQPSPAHARPAAGLTLSQQQRQQVQGLLSGASGHGTRSAGAGRPGRRPSYAAERIEDPRIALGGVITSNFRGVSFDKKKRKWRVQIKVASLGKSGVSVGYYDTEEAGARAYDRAAIGLLGRNGINVNTNFPLSEYSNEQIPVLAGLTREEVKETLKNERAKQAPRRRVSNRQRTSQFMGVGSSNRKNQWQARILVGGKVTHLGYYETEQQAAEVYDRVALAIHGPEAQINFNPDDYDMDEKRHLIGLSREELQRALGVKPMDKSSQYRGVSKKKGRWEAKVMVDRKWAYRELFDSETEAAAAYDAAVWRLKPREAKSYVNFKERLPPPDMGSARKARHNPRRFAASMSPEDVSGFRQPSHLRGEMDDDEDDYLSEADLSDDGTADDGAPNASSPEKRARLSEFKDVRPKQEPLYMEELQELGQGPSDHRSSLASPIDRRRLQGPSALPDFWGQANASMLHQAGGALSVPFRGPSADAAPAQEAAQVPQERADGGNVMPEEDPTSSQGLPAAPPLSMSSINLLAKVNSDLRDFANLEAFPGSPNFSQIMMGLPGNPANHHPLLRQEGSLGSLGPLLEGCGPSGNFISELVNLHGGGELSSPMDVGVKSEGMDISGQPDHFRASPSAEQVAGWGANASSMLHQHMAADAGPGLHFPPSSLVPLASTHWLNQGQPMQLMQTMPVDPSQAQLFSLPRSASAGDLGLSNPEGEMNLEGMEDNRLLDSAPAGWPHLLHGSPSAAGDSPMSLGAVPAVPSACRRRRASRLGGNASPRTSNLRPVSAPVVPSHAPVAMMPAHSLPIHDSQPSISSLPALPPALRTHVSKRRMTAGGYGLEIEECQSPLTAHVHIGGEELHLPPYEQMALNGTDYLIEPDMGAPDQPGRV